MEVAIGNWVGVVEVKGKEVGVVEVIGDGVGVVEVKRERGRGGGGYRKMG